MHDRPEILARFLRLLAHRDRVRIIARLARKEWDVSSLARDLALPQARTSQHLALLRTQRVVQDRRSGRRVLYRLVDRSLSEWAAAGLRLAENFAWAESGPAQIGRGPWLPAADKKPERTVS